MEGAGTEALERREMFGCAVAFMVGKAVAWIAPVVSDHDAVARDLGDDAGSGDRVAESISLDQWCDGQIEEGNGAAVEQDVLWRRPECGDNLTHHFMSGLQDVENVNPGRIEAGDLPADVRVARQPGKEIIAFLGAELFGIIEATEIRGQPAPQP